MRRRCVVCPVPGLLLALLLGSGLGAQPLAPQPTPPDAGVQQEINAQLPLDLAFIDSEGRSVRLGDYFGDRPVVLVLGYYRCPQLCGLLMHGLLQALHEGGLPRQHYRLLRVSIDPQETPADARARRAADIAYAHLLDDPLQARQPLELRALTGPPASLRALAQRVGYRYQRADGPVAGSAGWAHPTLAIVITPQGRVSSYLGGVRLDPQDLRLAVLQADQGLVGGFTDRLALLCAHVDPRLGRHSVAVLRGLQVLGALLVAALAAVGWHASTARASRRTGA